ncbi:hypothetical protein [Mycoplasma hafezii]|uniref:SLAC1 family transporter n=1 Tax=Mycoplasma hafezii TaxID=525886 RepID=UPI003CEA67D8
MKTLKEKLSDIPLGLSGLSLGTVGLGGALSAFASQFSNLKNSQTGILETQLIVQVITVFLCLIYCVLVSLKFALNHKQFLLDLKTPNASGFVPTLFMSICCIANFIGWTIAKYGDASSYLMLIPNILMQIGFLGQLICLGFFFKHVFLKHDYKEDEAFASWFVPLVGIGICCGFTENLGNLIPIMYYQIIWIVAFAFYLYIMPVVLYKFLFKPHKDMKDIPSMLIFAAPPNLLSVGLLTSFNPNILSKGITPSVLNNESLYQILGFLMLLCCAVGVALFLCITRKVLKQSKFLFSWSCLTFPCAITTTSIFKYAQYFFVSTRVTNFAAFSYTLTTLGVIFLLLATAIIAYVNWKYIKHIFMVFKPKPEKA